jgi:Asp/Glu/hydantoin racemase
MTKIFYLHTVSNLYPMFNELSVKYFPEAKLTHISDESLIQRALEAEGLTPAIEKRLLENILAAEEAGADFIQVTCSSMTPVVIRFKEKVKVPLLSIDEPVAKMMVQKYQKVGVIATAISTLNPSTQLVKDMAAAEGKSTEVVSRFCEGAYDAFFAGNMENHDEIVIKNLKELMDEVDAILLAQVSMARVANTLNDKEKKVPIETSPEWAVKHLAGLLG